MRLHPHRVEGWIVQQGQPPFGSYAGEPVNCRSGLGQPAEGHEHPCALVQDGGALLAGRFYGGQFFQGGLCRAEGKPTFGSSDSTLHVDFTLDQPMRHWWEGSCLGFSVPARSGQLPG